MIREEGGRMKGHAGCRLQIADCLQEAAANGSKQQRKAARQQPDEQQKQKQQRSAGAGAGAGQAVRCRAKK